MYGGDDTAKRAPRKIDPLRHRDQHHRGADPCGRDARRDACARPIAVFWPALAPRRATVRGAISSNGGMRRRTGVSSAV